MPTIAELMSRFPRNGRVEWIGVRPARRQAVRAVRSVAVHLGGLDGDHRVRPGPRAVTLLQHEHLPVIASLTGRRIVDPALLRRNVVVSGINVAALRGQTFRLGSAVLRGTERCAPCSRMEEVLGEGGYNAMRSHGGLRAEVIEAGVVSLGDEVVWVEPAGPGGAGEVGAGDEHGSEPPRWSPPDAPRDR